MNATLTFAETFTAEDAAAHWRTLQVTIGGGARHVEQMLLRTVRPWLIRAQAAGMVADWSMLRPPWDPAGSAVAELRINLRCADRTQAADLRYQIEAANRGEPGVMVVERAFSPAVERFGGPYGMAVCMTHLSQASKISAATIQATTPGAQRLHAASTLLLASARALRGNQRGQIDWLQGYARSQGAIGDGPRVDLGLAEAAAESACLRGDDERLRRRDALREMIAGPDADWYQTQCATWSALRDLRAAGLLRLPPEAIYSTFTQITHNQLGLLPRHNAYLAMLVAMALSLDPGSGRRT